MIKLLDSVSLSCTLTLGGFTFVPMLRENHSVAVIYRDHVHMSK